MIGRALILNRNLLNASVARNQIVRRSHDDGGIPGAVSFFCKKSKKKKLQKEEVHFYAFCPLHNQAVKLYIYIHFSWNFFH